MTVWDPFRFNDLHRLRREMDQLFDAAAPKRGWPLGFLPGTGARQYPRVNLAETADGYVAEALAPGVDPAMIDDIIFGCAMPEGEQGMNIARLITLAAGFPTAVPAITVNRKQRKESSKRSRSYPKAVCSITPE